MRRGLPLLVWSAALVGVLVLVRNRMAIGQVIGLARVVSAPVSSLVAGRLESLAVTLNQDVEAGAIIATLDGSGTLLEIEAAQLEVERLRAEIGAAEQRLLLDDATLFSRQTTLRSRLELDRLDARLGWIAEQGLRDRDAALLVGLSAQLDRMLEVAGYSEALSELDRVRAEHNALLARIRGRDSTIETWRQAEEGAVRRLAELPPATDLTAEQIVAPLEVEVRLAEKRLEQASQGAARLVLRAPFAGRVSAILQRPGEAVVVDEPIVQIALAETTEVLAWLHEEQLISAEVGRTVELRRFSDPKTLGVGAIESRGPTVTQLPQHALADPTRPEYGVLVVVRAPAELALVPGERVAIHIER